MSRNLTFVNQRLQEGDYRFILSKKMNHLEQFDAVLHRILETYKLKDVSELEQVSEDRRKTMECLQRRLLDATTELDKMKKKEKSLLEFLK